MAQEFSSIKMGQSEHLKHPLTLNVEAICPLCCLSGCDGEGTW